MATEIERKFLVRNVEWKSSAQGITYRQGYLCTDPQRTVRVRIAGDRGMITVKGKSEGAARAEFEYPIPLADATHLLDHLCLRPLVEKTRYVVEQLGHTWEIDEFQGENSGLLLAEVELASPSEEVRLPPWVGDEVTEDPRYYNANLIANPYSRWGGEDTSRSLRSNQR